MRNSRRAFLRSVLAGFAAIQALNASAGLAYAGGKDGLATRYIDDFMIGSMIDVKFLLDPEPDLQALVAKEFNALTTDNIFKWDNIHPAQNIWNWAHADVFVDYAAKHNMYAVGHPLVWHSQVPEGLFSKRRLNQKSSAQYMDVLLDHISQIVGRYAGSINAWDVVNEAFDDDGNWVRNNWYQIIGETYIEESFKAARPADPTAVLIYNDYNLWKPVKRRRVIDLIKDFKRRGVPIDAVGMQGHIGLGYPDLALFEESIAAFGEQGVKVHITELDVDVLPGLPEHEFPQYKESLDPYRVSLPEAVSIQLAERYRQVFEILVRQKTIVERVTLWGVSDRHSWRNDFPIPGRTNHPLLFDRALQRKSAYDYLYQLK